MVNSYSKGTRPDRGYEGLTCSGRNCLSFIDASSELKARARAFRCGWRYRETVWFCPPCFRKLVLSEGKERQRMINLRKERKRTESKWSEPKRIESNRSETKWIEWKRTEEKRKEKKWIATLFMKGKHHAYENNYRTNPRFGSNCHE